MLKFNIILIHLITLGLPEIVEKVGGWGGHLASESNLIDPQLNFCWKPIADTTIRLQTEDLKSESVYSKKR